MYTVKTDLTPVTGAISTSESTLTGLINPKAASAVPTVDDTENVSINQVIGNKSDSVRKTVGTGTYSIISMVKGILWVLGFFYKAVKDTVANIWCSDVIGNKEDTSVFKPSSTASIIGYEKGISSLTDKLYTPKMAGVFLGAADNSTYTEVVNVTDKGILTGISQFIRDDISAGTNGHVKIVIDGTTVYDGVFCYYSFFGSANWTGHNSLSFIHQFNTSLVVYHKASASEATAIHTLVSYTIDS